METHELIKALKDGKGLKKVHKWNDSSEIRGIEFLFYDSTNKIFVRKGWSSALGDWTLRMKEIFDFPENWEIAKPIEEKEWLIDNPNYNRNLCR